MKFIRVVILIYLLIGAIGCATGKKTDATMQTWMNSNVSELVTSWGPPDSSVQLPDGKSVYTWTSRGSYTMPTTTNTTASVYGYGNSAYGNAQSTTTGGQTLHFSCQKSFIVSGSGTIISYDWRGNSCR